MCFLFAVIRTRPTAQSSVAGADVKSDNHVPIPGYYLNKCVMTGVYTGRQ